MRDSREKGAGMPDPKLVSVISAVHHSRKEGFVEK